MRDLVFRSPFKKFYERIKLYQRQLARKCVVNGNEATQTKNYAKTRAKLQRTIGRLQLFRSTFSMNLQQN